MGVTSTNKVPRAVKVLFTGYMAVFTSVYWYLYGPTNFLYLSL